MDNALHYENVVITIIVIIIITNFVITIFIIIIVIRNKVNKVDILIRYFD